MLQEIVPLFSLLVDNSTIQKQASRGVLRKTCWMAASDNSSGKYEIAMWSAIVMWNAKYRSSFLILSFFSWFSSFHPFFLFLFFFILEMLLNFVDFYWQTIQSLLFCQPYHGHIVDILLKNYIFIIIFTFISFYGKVKVLTNGKKQKSNFLK